MSSGPQLPRKRLLFLCQTLPYPPDGGVTIRSFNTMRLLARFYDVTALVFYRKATARDLPASLRALNALGPTQAVPIPQEHSRVRLLADHARSLLLGRVYTYFAHDSAEFDRLLRQTLRENSFDLVHFDSLDLSAHLPACEGLRTIVVHHNVESALLRRRSKLDGGGLRGRYMAHQADLMEREERRWCPKVQLNVLVSPDDERILKDLNPGVRTTVVPNGVDTDAFQPADVPRSGLVFVGGMTWFPNRDALEWFGADILPHLKAAGPVPHIEWVGRATPEATSYYHDLGIKLTGYVDDIRPYVNGAACYIVPLRVGGGTRLKILDAWALGKAVVSTSIGAEGLDARDGENIIIRDDPKAFADAVRAVCDDPALQRRLGENARRTAEATYSWDVIGRSMIADYERVRLEAQPLSLK